MFCPFENLDLPLLRSFLALLKPCMSTSSQGGYSLTSTTVQHLNFILFLYFRNCLDDLVEVLKLFQHGYSN